MTLLSRDAPKPAGRRRTLSPSRRGGTRHRRPGRRPGAAHLPWPGVLVLLVSLSAGRVAAHGCHHRGDHAHDPVQVAEWIARARPDMDADAVASLLGQAALGPLLPPETILEPGPGCPVGHVQPPAGWYAGDTHVHVQGCPPVNPQGSTPEDIVDAMVAQDLDVVSGLLFGQGAKAPDDFAAQWAPLITGTPHPASTDERVLQFGLESSAFSADRHGHHIGLNVEPEQADIFALGIGCEPLFDGDQHSEPVDWLDYFEALQAGEDPTQGVYLSDGSGGRPWAVFELFRQGPRAVTGWAHQMWPVELYADPCDGGWFWEAESLPDSVGAGLVCGHAEGRAMAFPRNLDDLDFLHPVTAPVDVALGLVDFLEALNLDVALDGITEPPLVCGDWVDGPMQVAWYGLYHKLLDAGLRVSISGGSDAPCTDGFGCPPRTYVRTGQPQVGYDAWTAGLKAGRVSLASSGHHFLDLEVLHAGRSHGPGGQVELESGGAPARARVTLRVESDGSMVREDRLELLVDGEVVAAMPFGPLPPGSHLVSFPAPVVLDVGASSWVAARSGFGVSDPDDPQGFNPGGSTHTGAVWLVLDGRPQVDCEQLEAFMLYCDYIGTRIDAYEAAAAKDPLGAVLLKKHVGCAADRALLRQHLAAGRQIFTAMRDYAHGPPGAVVEFGRSTYAPGRPPLGLTVDRDPSDGSPEPVVVSAFHAPQNQPLPGSPPETRGWLLVGTAPASPPIPVGGADVHVDLGQPFAVVAMPVDSGGFSRIRLFPTEVDEPTPLSIQALFLNPQQPSSEGPLTATNALRLTLMPTR